MSALFADVSRRFEAGHDTMPEELWIDPRIHQIETFKPAAVLIALTERPRPGMLLLHRPSTMRAHPGQIAFPGGRLDPGETAVEAALREAEEELGIHPRDVQVIGTSDLYRTGSGYEITPVIGVVPPISKSGPTRPKSRNGSRHLSNSCSIRQTRRPGGSTGKAAATPSSRSPGTTTASGVSPAPSFTILPAG